MADLVRRDSAHLFVGSRDGLLGIQLEHGEPQIVPWGLYRDYVCQVQTDAKGVVIAASVRDGSVRTSSDGGKQFADSRGLDGADVRVLSGEGAVVYAGTGDAKMFKSTDSGRSFTELTTFDDPWGQEWSALGEQAAPRVSAIVVRDSRVIVGIAAGGVVISESGGENFRKAGDGLPREVLTLQAPKDNDELVYAGTLDGLYVTTKLGTNVWRHMYSPRGRRAVTAIGIDPTEPNRLLFGSSRALYLAKPAIPAGADAWVFSSEDGGQTWTPLDESLLPVIRGVITAFVHLPSDPKRVLFGTNAGEIFESENGGRTFFMSSSTLPGVLDMRAGNSC